MAAVDLTVGRGRLEGEQDSHLVQQAREDSLAFAELYRRYHGQVFRYLRLRSHSTEDAADLTQQVFLKALDGLPRYKPGGAPFAAWLFRIARNVAVDASRRRRVTADLDLVPDAVLADDTADPEAGVLTRERLEGLRVLISRLEPEQRELLALRYAGGLSSREIAAVVGRSESAVKKQLTRLLNTLKEKSREVL